MARITIRLSDAAHERLKARAAAEHTTVGRLARLALEGPPQANFGHVEASVGAPIPSAPPVLPAKPSPDGELTPAERARLERFK